MGIIADHIEHMSKDDLSTHHHKLLEMFLMALDYRANNHQVTRLSHYLLQLLHFGIKEYREFCHGGLAV